MTTLETIDVLTTINAEIGKVSAIGLILEDSEITIGENIHLAEEKSAGIGFILQDTAERMTGIVKKVVAAMEGKGPEPEAEG